MFEAFKAYNALPPHLKAAVTSKRIAGEFTLPQLLADLAQLSAFDKLNDDNRGGLGCALVALVLAIFADIFLLAALFPPAFVLLIPIIGVMIWLGLTMRRLNKLDLSNNFREVAMPFLAVLKQDVEPHQPMSLELELSAPTAAHKKKGAAAPYKAGAYYKIVDTSFQDAWFRGAARLADGAVLSFAVADDIVESQRSKRNGRGKHKTKTRHYRTTVIDTELALPTKTFSTRPPPPPQPGARTKMSVDRGAKRDTLSLTKKIKARSLDPLTPDILIGCVAELYRLAQPAPRSAA